MNKSPEHVEAYFKEQEIQLIKELQRKRESEKFSREKEERKTLHYMHCPKCGADMEAVMMEEIEVDKCPECMGVYFDNGELEQLFETEFEKRKTVIHKIFGLK